MMVALLLLFDFKSNIKVKVKVGMKMALIKVKLLGTPSVFINNKKVLFPFMKAEALFYYLSVKKQATRDELVALFWGDSPEKTAKKNLRNAMYKIRKAFNLDIIISPQKSMVMLNPEFEIDVDIDFFLKDEGKKIDIYQGEFLEGFLVKRADPFEEWMYIQRNYYKKIYINELYKKLQLAIKVEDFAEGEFLSSLLINQDELDERPYRILMDIYKKQSNYNKAIELYNKLKETLINELGIEPDNKTKEVIKNIIILKETKELNSGDNADFFYGRQKELNSIILNYNNFVLGKKYNSIIISGEAGIGKTKLKEKFVEFINKEDVFFLETNCYQVEERFFLKPWNSIFLKLGVTIRKEDIEIPKVWKKLISYLFPGFYSTNEVEKNNPIEQIDTLKFHVIEDAILGLFNKLTQRKKVLLIFEDIQWLDEMSLTLLSSLILRNKNVILIGTCRNTARKRIEDFITTMRFKDILDIIELKRFSSKEVFKFIVEYIPDIPIDENTKNKIFMETEGNPFFLIEFLNMIKEKGYIDNNMSSKAQDILNSRFLDISEEGQKVLNIISMFFDEISLNTIKDLTGFDELILLDIIEELEKKYLIKEIIKNDIVYQYTHQKLREHAYYRMSAGKRRFLHKKIAAYLICNLSKNDISIYPKIIHHLSNSGNYIDALKYLIEYLDSYLDFKHELFPVIGPNIPEKNYLSLNKEQVLDYFEYIEDLLEKIDDKENVQIELNKMAFFHMKGRFYIREGKYDEGTQLIKKMIESALKLKRYDYILKGYRQMIYYSIQIHDIEGMDKYINRGLDYAEKLMNKEEMAIFFRLKGLNLIMKENYTLAEETLKNSINIFKQIDDSMEKYSLNIAACYNYIGEIRRHRMKFAQALNFYDKAIKLCEKKRILRGQNIFNTNAGQAAYEMGDYDSSRKYLEKALEINRQLDSIWGCSIVEGYLALLRVKEGKYKEAMEHLKNAEKNSNQLKSPYEEGIVYRIKAEIKSNMDNNKDLREVFSDYLKESKREYGQKGIELLKKVKEGYEIEIIRTFLK